MKQPLPTGTPIADVDGFLTEFARTFVHKEFRDRFVHEAVKKSGRLHSRICHEIEDVFPSRYAEGALPFATDDLCVAICGTRCDLQEFRWVDRSVFTNIGFGAVVASRVGDRFYAETEFEFRHPYKIYSSPKHRAAFA